MQNVLHIYLDIAASQIVHSLPEVRYDQYIFIKPTSIGTWLCILFVPLRPSVSLKKFCSLSLSAREFSDEKNNTKLSKGWERRG